MIDENKRQTLKKLGVVATSTAILSHSTLSAAEPLSSSVDVYSNNKKTIGVSDVSIELFATTSVPESTLILKNVTDETLIIRNFLPGSVFFGQFLADLNEVVSTELVLPAGETRTLPITLRSADDTETVNEYVWAEDAVTEISQQTWLVSLGAFIADARAVVYPIPSLTLPA